MDVWKPARVCMSVGMANVPPESPNFSANIARSHDILLTV